jgi:hypothetical protein
MAPKPESPRKNHRLAWPPGILTARVAAVAERGRLGASLIAEPMKAISPTFACMAALATALLLSGCSGDSSGSVNPPVGKTCKIQFRRDALGTAATLPVSPLTDSLNGGETSISGTLKSTSEDWLVLDRGGKETWIPKSVVLLIEF